MKKVAPKEVMSLPGWNECLELMRQEGMPEHIERHSILVARVAVGIARALIEQKRGQHFDLDLVESAALLHDIGKAKAILSKGDHAVLGAEMLDGMGYSDISKIVREHCGLTSFTSDHPLNESLLVNYSDKRVMHDTIVSLEVRFDDLGERYAKTEKSRQLLAHMITHYLRLEKAIFQHLPFGPSSIDRFLKEEG